MTYPFSLPCAPTLFSFFAFFLLWLLLYILMSSNKAHHNALIRETKLISSFSSVPILFLHICININDISKNLFFFLWNLSIVLVELGKKYISFPTYHVCFFLFLTQFFTMTYQFQVIPNSLMRKFIIDLKSKVTVSAAAAVSLSF